MNQFTREKFSAISKIDSKGRISIPIALRLKLKMLEGSSVSLLLQDNKLVLIPIDGWSDVTVSIDDCGLSRLGSIPSSGLKRGEKNEK